MIPIRIVSCPCQPQIPTEVNIQTVPLSTPLIQIDVRFTIAERAARWTCIDDLHDDSLTGLCAGVGGVFPEVGDAVAGVAFYVAAGRMGSCGEGRAEGFVSGRG